VFDAIHWDTDAQFDRLGKTSLYVYLQTADGYSVRDSEFIAELADFRSAVLAEVSVVTHVFSMVDLGYIGINYTAMYINPEAPEYKNYTEGLVYPIGLTNMVDSTYVSFAIDQFRFSNEAQEATKSIRAITKRFFIDSSGQSMLSRTSVTGTPAEVYDLYQSLKKNIYPWIIVMMVSVSVLLVFMTKSIILPLKAVTLSLLSLGATLGIIVLFFTTTDTGTQKALNFVSNGYVDGGNLIFIFSTAFALSVDYELFLLSAIQEEFKKHSDMRRSILVAMHKTGFLITSAAVMLGITTFAFIVNQVAFMKLIGVGIAIAVVLDASIIRMLMVPSFIVLVGKHNWYCPEPLASIVEYVGFQEIELEPLDNSSFIKKNTADGIVSDTQKDVPL